MAFFSKPIPLKWKWFSLLVVVPFLAGCMATLYPPLVYDVEIGSRLARVSRPVSLYMSQPYKHYTGWDMLQSEAQLYYRRKFRVGEALEMFTVEYLKLAFDEVHVMEGFPEAPGAFQGDYLIVPDITHFNHWLQPIISWRHFVSVELEFRIYDKELNLVYAKRVRTQADSGWGVVLESKASSLTSEAIQKTLVDLINGFVQVSAQLTSPNN